MLHREPIRFINDTNRFANVHRTKWQPKSRHRDESTWIRNANIWTLGHKLIDNPKGCL